MVGVTGFGPAISASQTRRDGLTSLHPQSGWQESDLLPPRPERGALPMSYNPSSGSGGNRTHCGNACKARPLP